MSNQYRDISCGVRGARRVWQACARVPRALPFDPIDEAQRQWRRHWGGSAVPAMAAVTSIMRAEQILVARLNELLKEWDLTFPRYEALMLLFYSRRGSLPLGKMGERLQVHRTSVTSIVDGLERLGYVRRGPHESDRRTTLATITDRGREVAAAATEVLNRERFATAPLGRDELVSLYEVLRRLREGAEDFTAAP
jgi:DNA-binding MarR family transcriptional regulator